MVQAQSEAETALKEVQNLLETQRQLIKSGKLAADFTYRLDGYENELNKLKTKWQNTKNIAENSEYYEIAQEEFNQVTRDAGELKSRIQEQIPSPEENKIETLPTTWANIQPDTVYQTKACMLVSFSNKQIIFATTKDRDGNHLRAIDKGEVPPQGHQGLVRSEEPGFDFKSKVLSKKVSHYRFHGKMIDGVLHFPGKVTNKK
ncbi:hypothetical protein [Microseira wollei]|uniref:Uncharacterized protein n=1 Tax=Microseira wollei NIES-4236 TaxID=2530354 RepID=A0AAV3X5S7_9CYAN|nr:hypothetical protein [Microseira wollei]GET35955.1 hypothetical protein MiSe_07030 [Microseira wollei NIES-4236]